MHRRRAVNCSYLRYKKFKLTIYCFNSTLYLTNLYLACALLGYCKYMVKGIANGVIKLVR